MKRGTRMGVFALGVELKWYWLNGAVSDPSRLVDHCPSLYHRPGAGPKLA